MDIPTKGVLIDYYKSLESNPGTPYPIAVSSMTQETIDAEVSKLFHYAIYTTKCNNIYYFDVPEEEILRFLKNPNDNIRVSALLSLIGERIPSLQIKNRV